MPSDGSGHDHRVGATTLRGIGALRSLPAGAPTRSYRAGGDPLRIAKGRNARRLAPANVALGLGGGALGQLSLQRRHPCGKVRAKAAGLQAQSQRVQGAKQVVLAALLAHLTDAQDV